MKRFKCLVEKCGHVTRTKSGITSHVRNHHSKAMVKGTTYETTHNPVSNPTRNGPKKAKVKKASPKIVITPETRYIDIPCMLCIRIDGLKVEGLELAI